MKKMRNGRRGFTLLEIVIVVAIIVILSTAAFLGVAATVNRASAAQENLSINNGENFEAYARNQVDSYGKDMVYWDPIPNYTPENQAKKMKEQMLAEGWTDGEITFEYHEDGWHIVAEWDPTLEEHRGFTTPEDYKLWLSNYNHYIDLGYTKQEIENGCTNGSTDIKPVWDASLHDGKSEEQYLKEKQGGGSSGGSNGGDNGGGNNGGGNNGGGSNGGDNGSGNNGGGQQGSSMVSTYVQANQGNVGTIEASTSGNTTTLHITDCNGWNNLEVKLTKGNDGEYTVELGNAQYNLNGQGCTIPPFPNYVQNQGTYTLDKDQKAWFTKYYGVNFD